MGNKFKPAGYNSVSPYFIVQDADRFITFLKDLFDGELMQKYEDGGRIMHAEVRVDDSIIMLGEASEQYPPTGFWMHVYVPDAMATYQRALDLGCEGIEAPVVKETDPDLRGTFKDFAGNYWALGTQKS